ncbi:hypothetical protein SAY87_029010 [Trapa incisa]|uniref:Uncharacterized protein n=1 Tax=Trapa incisa TaxID=236973 RepID=A0AAN7L3D6_9MYRT|nr:hypothetical protein SAY87_029010 [Trapa incisa]
MEEPLSIAEMASTVQVDGRPMEPEEHLQDSEDLPLDGQRTAATEHRRRSSSKDAGHS